MKTPPETEQPHAPADFPPQKEGENAFEYLLRLEESGKFLFHGSPYPDIHTLLPKEATDSRGDEWGNDTAVYAVPAVIAVGRAILPPREDVIGDFHISSSRAPDRPGGPCVTISANIIPQEGTVYVVAKDAFVKNPQFSEWKAHQPIEVLAEVHVTPDDFIALGGRIEVLGEGED